VSEENGSISLASGGKLSKDLEQKDILAALEKAFIPRERKKSFPVVIKRLLARRKRTQG